MNKEQFCCVLKVEKKDSPIDQFLFLVYLIANNYIKFFSLFLEDFQYNFHDTILKYYNLYYSKYDYLLIVSKDKVWLDNRIFPYMQEYHKRAELVYNIKLNKDYLSESNSPCTEKNVNVKVIVLYEEAKKILDDKVSLDLNTKIDEKYCENCLISLFTDKIEFMNRVINLCNSCKLYFEYQKEIIIKQTEDKLVKFYTNPINLIGPITFKKIIYENYNKEKVKILLFGDLHVEDPVCFDKKQTGVYIWNYIDSILYNNQNKAFDIMTETFYVTKNNIDTKLQNCYINRVSSVFNNCYEIDKSKCMYKNARFHYINVRNMNKALFNILTLISIIGVNSDKFDFIPYATQYAKVNWDDIFKIDDEIKEMKRKRNEENEERRKKGQTDLNDLTDEDYFYQTFKIGKQLNNSWLSFPQRGALYKYFKRRVTVPDWKKMKQLFDKLLTTVDTIEIRQTINMLVVLILYNFFNWIMDFYTVGRMFRKYKLPGSGINYEPQCTNIIVYVGNAHISNIVDIFSHISTKKENQFNITIDLTSTERNKSFQCIHISKEVQEILLSDS